MPRTKRDAMKRTIAQVVNHLQAGAEDLIPLEELFASVHPAEASLLTLTLTSIDVTISLIKRFCETAWGYFPDNLEDWRSTGYTPVDQRETAEDPKN